MSSAPGTVALVKIVFAGTTLYVFGTSWMHYTVAGDGLDHSLACVVAPTSCTFHHRNHWDNMGIRMGHRHHQTHWTEPATVQCISYASRHSISILDHADTTHPHALSSHIYDTKNWTRRLLQIFWSLVEQLVSVTWCSAYHIIIIIIVPTINAVIMWPKQSTSSPVTISLFPTSIDLDSIF